MTSKFGALKVFVFDCRISFKVSIKFATNFGHFEWTVAGSAISNGREPKSCLGQVFSSKLGHIAILHNKCMAWHTATSRVENSAQGLSCQLKFVHDGSKWIKAKRHLFFQRPYSQSSSYPPPILNKLWKKKFRLFSRIIHYQK